MLVNQVFIEQLATEEALLKGGVQLVSHEFFFSFISIGGVRLFIVVVNFTPVSFNIQPLHFGKVVFLKVRDEFFWSVSHDNPKFAPFVRR